MKNNDMLSFYGEHKISPVHQDVENLSIHYERRRKLYRQCGIPLQAFRNAEILEVGPGSGYNTLALFQFLGAFEKGKNLGGGCITLIEPNPRGVMDLTTLFEKHLISEKQYQVFPGKIEDFQSDKKFDFVLAEGFVQFADNAPDIISKLADLTKPNGILVFTCCDDVCMFIEGIKRLMGVVLTQGIDDYEKKVERLVAVFEPQLRQLRGVSRPTVDWVQDQLLNPAVASGRELTMAEAIETVGDSFYVLGASPQIFNDYSWYKDIWHNTRKAFKEQFCQKRMSLLLAGMPECILPVEQVNVLVTGFGNIRSLANEYETNGNVNLLKDILSDMEEMEPKVMGFPADFITIFQEIKGLLKEAIWGEIHMDRYPHFCAAFGRTLQYIAFEKRNDYFL